MHFLQSFLLNGMRTNPLSIIESLSLGTPVIGSNIGGIPELIQDEKQDSHLQWEAQPI